jgi:hypothetical protein
MRLKKNFLLQNLASKMKKFAASYTHMYRLRHA